MRPYIALLLTPLICLIFTAPLRAQATGVLEECRSLTAGALEGAQKKICDQILKSAANQQADKSAAEPADGTTPKAEPTATAPSEVNLELVRAAQQSCEASLDQTRNSCQPTAYQAPQAGDVSKMDSRQTAQAAGQLSENIGQQAADQTEKCARAAMDCRKACVASYRTLKTQCPGCGTAEISPIRKMTESCHMQMAQQAGNKNQTKQSKTDEEKAKEVVEKLERKPASEWMPKAGEAGGSNGGNEVAIGGGNSLPITIPSLPASIPVTANPTLPESAQRPVAAEEKSLKDRMKEKAESLFGSSELGEALLETEGMKQQTRLGRDQSAAQLYKALTDKLTATPAAEAKAKAAAASHSDPAHGRGSFVNAAVAKAAATAAARTAAANTSNAAQAAAALRSGTRPQSNSPAIQQAGGGEFNAQSMDQEVGRKPSSVSGGSSLADMNERMRMQRGDTGGRAGSVSGKSIPLSAYLPNGSMYRGQRGPAGANLPAHGIQSQGVDIWSLISKRMQARCLDGRLRDCR